MNERKIPISLSISKRLLAKIESDIEGSSRSAKITRCVEVGLKILTQMENEK